MRTRARRDGTDWVLDGRKMWISNGSIADVAVVWAQTEDGIRGFVVPTDTPGFSAPEIKHKLSLRASVTSELVLDGVRLPESAMLPEALGIKGPLSCLSEARYGIVWGALGAARSSLRAALEYAGERTQFGKPIAAFQLTQQKLADMNLEYTKGMLLALHLGRRKDAADHPRPGQPRQAQQRPRGDRDLPDRPHHPRGERDLAGVPGHPAHEQPGVGAHLRGNRGDAHAGDRAGDDRSRRVPLRPSGGSSKAVGSTFSILKPVMPYSTLSAGLA